MNSREEVKIMEVKSIDLPIDGSRLGTSATGNVSSVYKYQDESERKAGTARVQDLSEDGRFLRMTAFMGCSSVTGFLAPHEYVGHTQSRESTI
jgi:hypothetical protein